MFIDTTAPELQNFDPEKQGMPLPPVGVYSNITLQVIDSQQGDTQKGEPKLDITYEITTGELAGTPFKLTYNVGHSNRDTAKWAREDTPARANRVTKMLLDG